MWGRGRDHVLNVSSPSPQDLLSLRRPPCHPHVSTPAYSSVEVCLPTRVCPHPPRTYNLTQPTIHPTDTNFGQDEGWIQDTCGIGWDCREKDLRSGVEPYQPLLGNRRIAVRESLSEIGGRHPSARETPVRRPPPNGTTDRESSPGTSRRDGTDDGADEENGREGETGEGRVKESMESRTLADNAVPILLPDHLLRYLYKVKRLSVQSSRRTVPGSPTFPTPTWVLGPHVPVWSGVSVRHPGRTPRQPSNGLRSRDSSSTGSLDVVPVSTLRVSL